MTIEETGGFDLRSSITEVGLSNQDAAGHLEAVARHRDRSAFEQLYCHYAPRLKHYMQKQGADPATADDLSQEAMVQVWRKAELYNPARSAPSTWIFRIARNLQIDQLRKQKVLEVELPAEEDTSQGNARSEEQSLDQLDADHLKVLVSALPDDQMEVVRMAYFEGLSQTDIGNSLDIPLGTVKSRLRLAFGKLRTAFGEVA